jgi:hypothetical protein
MIGRGIVLVAVIGAAAFASDAAQAQFSPGGIIGGITRPFRGMLGHFGHFPRHHRHSAAAEQAPEAASRDPSPAAAGLGQSGPVAWPNALEDIVGFTLSPDEYARELRERGFGVIADTITGRFAPRPSPPSAATTGSAVQNDAGNGSPCRSFSNQNNWPAARVEQLMQLKDAQHDALDNLQAAVNHSARTVDCLDTASAPPDRLRMLVQALWTVHDAGISIRTPLKNFLDTLDSAQKAQFVGQRPQSNPPPNASNAKSGMNKQYQACAGPNVEAAERMIKEIEQRVRPNKQQAARLENLHKASSDMAKMLMASCAQAVPADPLARLDSAGDRLTAMNYAATSVQIAFDDFYGKLDRGQKARLEANGR